MQECFGFQTFLNSFLVAVEFLAPGVIVCAFVGGGGVKIVGLVVNENLVGK